MYGNRLTSPQGVIIETVRWAGGSVVDEALVQAVGPEECIGVIAAPDHQSYDSHVRPTVHSSHWFTMDRQLFYCGCECM